MWAAIALATAVVALLAVWGFKDAPLAPTPTPGLVTSTGEINWSGGAVCLDLFKWSDGDWRGTGSSKYGDARLGIWGPFIPDQEVCTPALAFEGTVTLPQDATPGVYRICDLWETACREFEYEIASPSR